MAVPASAQPATHFGSASLIREGGALASAGAAVVTAPHADVIHYGGGMPATSASSFGTGDPFLFVAGVPQTGSATAFGGGDLVHHGTSMSVTTASLFGALDVIHDSLPPEELIEILGMPQAGPAVAFGPDALRITTIRGMPAAGPAGTFQSAHHDTIHQGATMAPARQAVSFGTGIVAYVNDNGIPGIDAFGMAAAGPAIPIGHLWDRPEHMTGLVYPVARPSECAKPVEAVAPTPVINFPNSGVIFGPLQDPCRRSDYDPVKRMVVEGCYHLAVEKSVKVSFAFVRDFTEPGPYTIELYRGRAMNDDRWEKIAQVQDQSWIFDRRPQPRPHEHSTYYRLRVTDGNGVSYWCHPVSFDVIWNHYDWRLVKEIVRKELLIQGRRNGKARARGAGTRGWLLKKRQFGDPCDACVDPNTEAPTNSQCGVCYGTGVVGGFYDPLEYWVIQQPGRRTVRLSDAGDTRTTVLETVRALAHPSPEAGDIWISEVGDTRYEVQGDIEKLARHRGVDVILGLRLLELPTTHAAYRIPVDEMCRV